MPDIKDINQFKGILFSLGSEPEILNERGEVPEEIPVPETLIITLIVISIVEDIFDSMPYFAGGGV